jgi:predicted MPP superfamily phosphohydrolase
MVSDIHLGNLIDNSRLQDLVSQINTLHPDIILLAGDIIDEDVQPFMSQGMHITFRQLQAPYGVYAVLGNHEYIGGNPEYIVAALTNAGVNVLRDQVVKVADSFYVAGRDDRSVERQLSAGRQRQPLPSLLANLDTGLPLILLDHQPYRLDDSQANGVDLQLSGHTHYGQIFPNNLITGMIYEDDWGYLQKGKFQAIVSCGYGTWGRRSGLVILRKLLILRLILPTDAVGFFICAVNYLACSRESLAWRQTNNQHTTVRRACARPYRMGQY